MILKVFVSALREIQSLSVTALLKRATTQGFTWQYEFNFQPALHIGLRISRRIASGLDDKSEGYGLCSTCVDRVR